MSRKLKLQVQISIDGFIAGPNGGMDWLQWDWSNDIKKYVEELTDSIDTIILGRKLAEGFIPNWENIASDPNSPEFKAGKLFAETPKVVFSETLKDSKWNKTILANGSLAEEVNKLKSENGKDIITYGGAEFVSNLIKEKLIDELHLFVNPTALGNGMPIFNEVTKNQNFNLLSSQAFECGINALTYELKQHN